MPTAGALFPRYLDYFMFMEFYPKLILLSNTFLFDFYWVSKYKEGIN